MRISLCLLVILAATALVPVQPDDRPPESTGRFERLTLESALALAERYHPDLTEARALADAAGGRAQQASRLANPELIAGLESAPFQGQTLHQAEYLVGIAQAVPLSRRLSLAQTTGRLEQERLLHAAEAKLRTVHATVRNAFATALYQERAFQLQQQLSTAAESAAALARARSAAGDAGLDDVARAELEATRTRAESQRTQALHQQALHSLAGALGLPEANIASLDGQLATIIELPTLESLAAELARSPVLAAVRTDVAVHEARLDLARAERIPDLKIEVLYRRIEADQANALDVGFSVPLPLFHRNQGSLRAAQAERDAAEARAQSTELHLRQQLRSTHARLATALAQHRLVEQEVLPRADLMLRHAEARLRLGDLSLGEVLSVRREWASAQLSSLEALREVLQSWADLKTLL